MTKIALLPEMAAYAAVVMTFLLSINIAYGLKKFKDPRILVRLAIIGSSLLLFALIFKENLLSYLKESSILATIGLFSLLFAGAAIGGALIGLTLGTNSNKKSLGIRTNPFHEILSEMQGFVGNKLEAIAKISFGALCIAIIGVTSIVSGVLSFKESMHFMVQSDFWEITGGVIFFAGLIGFIADMFDLHVKSKVHQHDLSTLEWTAVTTIPALAGTLLLSVIWVNGINCLGFSFFIFSLGLLSTLIGESIHDWLSEREVATKDSIPWRTELLEEKGETMQDEFRPENLVEEAENAYVKV